METIQETTPELVIDIKKIPDTHYGTMTRILINCIKDYFDNPAVQKDFERWKAERNKRTALNQ